MKLDGEDHKNNRDERIAIMVADGKITEQEAHEHCDTKPEIYGERNDKSR